MSHWDTSDVAGVCYWEKERIKWGRNRRRRTIRHSDYYRKIEQDNAAIKEIFGSLIG